MSHEYGYECSVMGWVDHDDAIFLTPLFRFLLRLASEQPEQRGLLRKLIALAGTNEQDKARSAWVCEPLLLTVSSIRRLEREGFCVTPECVFPLPERIDKHCAEIVVCRVWGDKTVARPLGDKTVARP